MCTGTSRSWKDRKSESDEDNSPGKGVTQLITTALFHYETLVGIQYFVFLFPALAQFMSIVKFQRSIVLYSQHSSDTICHITGITFEILIFYSV